MNIAQVSSGGLRIPVEKGGGIEAYILHLSKSLSKAGHRVVIIDRKYSPTDPDVEYIDGVKIVRLSARRFPIFNYTIRFALDQIFFAYRVKKYLSKDDCEVIQVHHSVIGLFLAMASGDLRKKLYYLSQTSRRVKESVSLLDRMALDLENQLVKRTRKVMVLNELAREKLIGATKLNPGKVALIPVSIDIGRFNPKLDLGDVRQRYGLGERVTILFVGRICADKGVEYLIKAADIVVNGFGYKEAQFLVVGPVEQFGRRGKMHTPYLVKILGLIEDYGLKHNVRLTGALAFDDLRKLYAACDMFVLPSLTEAAPTASLEAIASGKPVIGTKVGGIPMQIRDGQSGFLIEPADERQLAERMKYLIDSPSIAKKMGAYGKKIVEEEFSSDKIAERLLQIYQDKRGEGIWE